MWGLHTKQNLLNETKKAGSKKVKDLILLVKVISPACSALVTSAKNKTFLRGRENDYILMNGYKNKHALMNCT